MASMSKRRIFELISSGANPIFEGDVPALLAHYVAQLEKLSTKISREEMAELIGVGVALYQLSIATDLDEEERQALVSALKRARGDK